MGEEGDGDGIGVSPEGGRPLGGSGVDGTPGERTTTVRYAPRGDNTKRAASALLDDLRRSCRPAGSGRMTVGQYLRSWLDTAGSS
jgi:hypothetical protein